MSDRRSWNLARRADYHGVQEIGGFRLKVYSIQVDDHAIYGLPECAAALDAAFASLGPVGFSDEFEYHKVGFAICNYGRRGLTILVFHYGVWVDTPEVFNLSWYRYLDSNEIELLDQAEPITCFIDSPWVLEELALWRRCVHTAISDGDHVNYDRAYASYFERPVSFG